MLRSAGSRCEHLPRPHAVGSHARVNALSGVDHLQLDLAEGEAQVGVSAAARPAAGAPRTAPESRCRSPARARRRGRTRSPPPSPARSARSRRPAGSRRRRSRRARRSRRRPCRSRSPCHSSSASPTRRAACSASTSSQRAGELKDAELHRAVGSVRRLIVSAVEQLDLVVLDQRVREQLLAHRLQLRRVLHVELDQAADVHVRHAREAERRQRALDGLALRVEDARLRADQHAGAHQSPAGGAVEPRLERLAGDPLVRLDVARARARDDVVAGSPAPAGACPSRCPRPSRARTACRSSAGRCPARSRRRASSARSRASAPRRRAPASPSSSRPNSNFVSARITPRSRACVGRERVQLDRHVAHPLHQRAVADQLGGALEVDRLVVAHLGLRARREDRLGQLLGLAQARRQLDPRDRAGRLVVLPARAGDVAAHDALDRQHLQLAHRPARGRAPPSGTPSVAEIRWLATICSVCSNQNTDSPVSTLPLSGIGVGWTAS